MLIIPLVKCFEQDTTVTDELTAGCFNPDVFVNSCTLLTCSEVDLSVACPAQEFVTSEINDFLLHYESTTPMERSFSTMNESGKICKYGCFAAT